MEAKELRNYITNVIRMILGVEMKSEEHCYHVKYNEEQVNIVKYDKGFRNGKIIKTLNAEEYNYSHLNEIKDYLFIIID